MATSPSSMKRTHEPSDGETARLKINMLRKSAVTSSSSVKRNVLMSKWKGPASPPPSTSVVTPNKLINDQVASYVNKCNGMHVEPVLDFVVALTDPSLTKCSLSDRVQPLAETEIGCIAETMRTNTTIEELDLRGNGSMSIPAAIEIGLALKVNKTLSKLHLDENDLKSEGVLRIAAGIRENTSNSAIEVLTLKSNQIGNHGAAGLAELLSTTSRIRHLDLQHNAIKDQGSIALAASLKVNSSLEGLNLRFNEVSDTGAAALGTALRLNHTLTELDLGGNKIGEDGAEELAGGLCENDSLLKLNLRSNQIGDNGAVSIAEALKINGRLREMYLGSNQIAATGCSAIADSLKENSTLTKLDLQGIQMGSSGALAIADALRVNTSITHLVLDLNQIGKEEATAIASAIRANPSLTELNLGTADLSSLDPDVVAAITSTLKLNKYVAGIVDDTKFSDHFKRVGSSMATVVGTSLPSSPSPVPSSNTNVNYLTKDIEKDMQMGDMLSTMGDKVKNLILREREGKKSTQFNYTINHNHMNSSPANMSPILGHSTIHKSIPSPTPKQFHSNIILDQTTIKSALTNPNTTTILINGNSHDSDASLYPENIIYDNTVNLKDTIPPSKPNLPTPYPQTQEMEKEGSLNELNSNEISLSNQKIKEIHEATYRKQHNQQNQEIRNSGVKANLPNLNMAVESQNDTWSQSGLQEQIGLNAANIQATVAMHKSLDFKISSQDTLISNLTEQLKTLNTSLEETANLETIFANLRYQRAELSDERKAHKKKEEEFKKFTDDQIASHNAMYTQLMNSMKAAAETPSINDLENTIASIATRVVVEQASRFARNTEQENSTSAIHEFHQRLENLEIEMKNIQNITTQIHNNIVNVDKLNTPHNSDVASIVAKELVENHDKTLRDDFEKSIRSLEEKIHNEDQAKVYLNEVRITTFGERITMVEKELSDKLRLIEKRAGLSATSNDRDRNSTTKEPDDKVINYLEEKVKRVEDFMRHQQAILKTLETRSASDSSRADRRIIEINNRIDMLEETLRAEQETSLKALEAILNE